MVSHVSHYFCANEVLVVRSSNSYAVSTILAKFIKISDSIKAHLEELVDKDATERSDAAREAFLAELALDSKKGNYKGGDFKHNQEKMKDKIKNTDHRKAKNLKVIIVSGSMSF
ncbi:hypothetical protein MKW98_008000 [Papaver atlanticum]|uniref:Uncharacterized protein n=1 Tax=Papaver atlanticum TaxID=357466 RepID=A0AAD4SWT0_9MAGN|nr:hypothetical protein MKW98_008000 [Papaver atlanticum]